MLRRMFIVGSVMLAANAIAAGATSERVVGVISAVGPGQFQVATAENPAKGVTSVKVNEKTGYLKWITHQPWQQDNRASNSWLAVGRCVDASVDGGMAKTVRVSVEPPTSIWDPCKSIRQ